MPVHCIVCQQICSKYSVPVLDRPPYSPRLASYNFYLLPEVISALKGTGFQTARTVNEKVTRVMNIQHSFEQWKFRMQRCRDIEGVYVEGDNN